MSVVSVTVFHMVSVQGIEPRPHEGDLLHVWYRYNSCGKSGKYGKTRLMVPYDSGMSFASKAKWRGRTQIKFSQFSHGWKNEFEATGGRGGGGREKSLLVTPVSPSSMVTSPNVSLAVLKLLVFHLKGEATGESQE